ncbi:MAG TPA: haloacid dehalogenase type II [Zeimonas sp.]
MPIPLRAVAFDAYGTLFDVHSVAALAEQRFPGQGVRLSSLWRSKQLEYTWLRTLSDRYAPFDAITRDALRWTARAMGLALAPADEDRLMAQYASLSAFPENLGALRELRALGLPLAILTNGTTAMVEISARSAGMHGLFDRILSADTVRRYKTHPAVYAMATDAFDCEPAAIVFVSSNAWDAAAASWFGFDAFRVDRAGAPAEELGTGEIATGHHLTDVVEHVRARLARERNGRRRRSAPATGAPK